MKIRPVEVKLFHTGGRTDGEKNRKKDRQTYRQGDRETGGMTNLIVALRKVANASEKS
jgi:hypothetical protein